jgi:hypothetical protein
VQVDLAIGGAVTPPPEWVDHPSLLNLPRPRLRACRRETSIAETVPKRDGSGARAGDQGDLLLSPEDAMSAARSSKA